MTAREALFVSHSESDTQRIAAALERVLPEQAVVALSGTLGAGKTRFVQALAAAAGIDPAEVTSPTFVLCQEHHGRRALYHFDAYRLAGPEEFIALGAHEYFDLPGVCLIEWAERVATALPDERIEVRIDVTGETERGIHLRAIGERYSLPPAWKPEA
jgi:tRNA threonylcarbamoyladenosine biosynthesis protein TsaE